MSMFSGRLGLALVAAMLCLGAQVAHAQSSPVNYWIPGWPMGFSGDAGESANAYGNFPSFDFRDVAISDVAKTFGHSFAGWIDHADRGRWEGPVTSAYGVHLARLGERIEARDPPLEEVREAARREWLHARKVVANDAFYDKLRSRYVIKVEAAPEQIGAAKLAEAAK